MRDAFLDIQSNHMSLYFVNDVCQVKDRKRYDLARISYCCGNHINDPRILSWIYRQEVDVGFQLECHAVRFDSDVKARCVASRLYMAVTSLYLEIESAVSQTGVLWKQATGGDTQTKQIPEKEAKLPTDRKPSYRDNPAFDNIEEHCLGMEYEADSVFTE